MSNSNIPINQHYVPKFYLENFKDEQHGLCLFERYSENKEIKQNQSPSKWAKQHSFYTVQPDILKNIFSVQKFQFPFLSYEIDFEKSFGIEVFFSQIEREVRKIFNEIIEGTFQFNKENKIKILYFLYFLAYRTNAYRKAMKFIHEQTLSQMKDRNYEEKYCESFTNAIGMQYGEKYYQISRLFNTNNISNFVNLYLNKYDWFIGKVNGSLGLLTSDDPAIIFLSQLPNQCFPIASKLALILCDKNLNIPMKQNFSNTILMTTEDVIRCNEIILTPTIPYKYVFGAFSDLELIKPIILKFENNKPQF